MLRNSFNDISAYKDLVNQNQLVPIMDFDDSLRNQTSEDVYICSIDQNMYDIIYVSISVYHYNDQYNYESALIPLLSPRLVNDHNQNRGSENFGHPLVFSDIVKTHVKATWQWNNEVWIGRWLNTVTYRVLHIVGKPRIIEKKKLRNIFNNNIYLLLFINKINKEVNDYVKTNARNYFRRLW